MDRTTLCCVFIFHLPFILTWASSPQCYAQTDTPTECTPQSEDYLECLHHTKAVRLSA